MGKRKIIDWEAIYKDYRCNQFSNVQLGKKYNISETAIRKKAKAENWEKDLAPEVRKQVREKLVRDVVREKGISDSEIIETAVQTNIEIIRGHRKSLSEGLRISESLIKQLETISDNREVLEDLVITLTEGDPEKDEKPDYKERAKLIKALSLPAHAGALRDLSAALKNLIPLERQAFGIDDTEKPNENPIIDLLNQISQNKKPLIPDDDEK